MTNIIIALLLYNFSSAQNALMWNTESWSGDITHFNVGHDGVLSLDAPAAGRSNIWSHGELGSMVRWDIEMMADFSTSSANYLRIYFAMNDTTLSSALGYAVHIGDSGTPDPIELLGVDSGDVYLIDMGPPVYSGEHWIRLSIVKSHDIIKVYHYASNGEPIEIILYATEMNGRYFGIECGYSESRKDRVHFRSVTFSSWEVDSTPPRLSSISVIDTSTIEVCFDEGVNFDSTIAEVDDQPTSVQLSERKWSCLNIALPERLPSPAIYPIDMLNVADTSGNVNRMISEAFEYNPPQTAVQGDILINEILYHPGSDGAPYLELIHKADYPIIGEDLLLVIKTNTKNDTLTFGPDISIPATEKSPFVLLTRDPYNIAVSYPVHDTAAFVEVASLDFPEHSAMIELSSKENGILDQMSYDESIHSSFLIDVEGKALERVTTTPNKGGGLWATASSEVLWGTPGVSNSQVHDPSVAENDCHSSTDLIHPVPDGYLDYVLLSAKGQGPASILTGYVFDISGRQVATISPVLQGTQGGYAIWRGTDSTGQIAPAGLYILMINMYNPLTLKSSMCRFGVTIAATE